MMQALDTMGRDGPTASSAPVTSRTLRSAVGASSPVVLIIAAIAVAASIGSSTSSLVPLAAALPVAMLVAPAIVDLLDHRLPNRMVAAAALIGAVTAAVTVVLGGDIDLRDAALGAIALAGPLLLMHLIAPGAMGFGDVKVACVLGAAVGMINPVYGLFALAIGALLGAVAGLIGRRRTIAFGPALVGGAIIVLVAIALPSVSVLDVAETVTPHSVERPSEVVRS